MRVFNFYSDPGHGWIKVPIEVLKSLGIADKVSFYSYYRKGFAYLEEDCDADLFFRAYRAKYGKTPGFREYNARFKSSKIRSYDNFQKGFYHAAI
jgi:CTP:phosphocholine cytidylyltransferase-like protein